MNNKSQNTIVKKGKKSRTKKLIAEKVKVNAKVEMPTKKNTSLRLEHSILKRLKIRAIEEDTSVQQLLEALVIQYLHKTK